MIWLYPDVSRDSALEKKLSTCANRARLLQLTGSTLPRLQGAIYWAEGSESVSKCDNGRQMVYCGRKHVGEFEELKYLEKVSGKHRYVTHKNSDMNKQNPNDSKNINQ